MADEQKVINGKDLLKGLAVNAMDAIKASGVGFVVTTATTALLLPQVKGKFRKALLVVGAAAIGKAAADAAHRQSQQDVNLVDKIVGAAAPTPAPVVEPAQQPAETTE